MNIKAQRRELLFNKITEAYLESNGDSLEKICCEHGITSRSYCNYRKEFSEYQDEYKSKSNYADEVELIKTKKHKSSKHKSTKKHKPIKRKHNLLAELDEAFSKPI